MEGVLEFCDPLTERQFLIAVKHLADTLNYGTDRSPFLGSGIEFVQSRLYQLGDPIKAIDWRVTARTGKVHIKEYEAPKRMPVYLLIDTSASMMVSSQKLSKYAWAIQIAGGLAFACLERVSPVGVLGVGERDFRILPSLSRIRVMEWLYKLRRFRFDEQTEIGLRVNRLMASLTHRSLIIVLSDLHDDKALPSIKLLGQRHDCAVLQLQDPAEERWKGSGLIRASEAETGREFVTHGRREWTNPEVVEEELRRAGVDHLLLRTDRPIAHRLRYFFQSRGMLGRGAR